MVYCCKHLVKEKFCMMKKVLMILMAACLLFSCTAAEEVTIPQVKTFYQYEIPETEAMAFVKDMKIGWNLGNTFDATDDGYRGNDLDIEKAWAGVKTTEEMIDTIHKAGFNTLRLPVSWHNHVDENFIINTPWLDRVQEVADWAIERGMYVIINIHHDNEKGYLYPTNEYYDTAEKYITTIWQQVAERFKDYDEHLIFEAMNEPRPKGTSQEWWFNSGDKFCQEVAVCIGKLNQAFVNTVRATGSNNATRYLMVPAYCASPDAATNTTWFQLPQDTVENKLIVSAHAYTPYSFALESPGTRSFDPLKPGNLTEITRFMGNLYNTFVSKGVPVVIGEFGAVNKNNNLQDRVNFYAYYIAIASSRNIPCVVWDNHNFSPSGEIFGLLDRRNLVFPEPILVETMMQYAGYDKMPVKE